MFNTCAPQTPPNFDHEERLAKQGYKLICGIDEAGRGAWAGDIVAAAVVLNPKTGAKLGLNDSKQLTANRRDALYAAIMQTALYVGVGSASPQEVDILNPLEATMLAMLRAVDDMPAEPDMCLIDGDRSPPSLVSTTLIHGDCLSLNIAAASIIAKVTRDRIMACLADDFPAYGWERNSGYGTALHLKGLEAAGVTHHHRKSFRPIQQFL